MSVTHSLVCRVTPDKKQRKGRSRCPQSERKPETFWKKRFQKLCYTGIGDKFLGWKLGAYEVQDDGTEELVSGDHPIYLDWSKRRCHPHDDYRETRRHFKGLLHGICRDQGETHLPGIAVEHDRHSGHVHVEDHVSSLKRIWGLLTGSYASFQWLTEINLFNGSTRFWGFENRLPIPVDRATEIGNEIRKTLERMGIKHECFPSTNCAAVMLPLRPDKLYLTDQGVIESCTEFYSWNGHAASWETIEDQVRRACANVADVEEVLEPPLKPVPPIPVTTDKPFRPRMSMADINREPNALTRTMEVSRRLIRAKGSHITVQELEEAYRGCHSGAWEGNAKRKHRLAWVVSRVNSTFDPSRLATKKGDHVSHEEILQMM